MSLLSSCTSLHVPPITGSGTYTCLMECLTVVAFLWRSCMRSQAMRPDGCDVQEAPPFEIPLDASRQPGSSFAGYVSMTVLPQHVSSRTKIDKLAWVLLTLQAQLHTSIKDFKVRALPVQSFLHVRCCCLIYHRLLPLCLQTGEVVLKTRARQVNGPVA